LKRMLVLFVIILTFLTGCSSNTAVRSSPGNTAKQTYKPTVAPTLIPTVIPTATPNPVPDVLSLLHSYYAENESDYNYLVERTPQPHPVRGYEMTLTYREVPQANGKATVFASHGSSDLEIIFDYSNFMGSKLCAPLLIRDVSAATVCAYAEMQGISNVNPYVEAVINSYDGSQYTSVITVGDYAFVYGVEGTYAAELTVKQISKFCGEFSSDEYVPATYNSLSAKLNAGSEYTFSATVKSIKSGQYRNTFSTYKCIMLDVELDSGETITIVQNPQNVPLSFEVGTKYAFFGTTMFDVSDTLLFYLHYAK